MNCMNMAFVVGIFSTLDNLSPSRSSLLLLLGDDLPKSISTRNKRIFYACSGALICGPLKTG
jgi:hypothetical protein